MVAGGIAKAYLMSRLGGEVNVKLNEGQCKVQEQDVFYYFRTSQKTSKCGTKRQVSCLQICCKFLPLPQYHHVTCLGQQNPHRVPEYAVCVLAQNENHPPAGF